MVLVDIHAKNTAPGFTFGSQKTGCVNRRGGLAATIGSPLGQALCPPVAVAIGNLRSMNTAPELGGGRWTSFGPLRNTPQFPQELKSGTGELNHPGSPPRRRLALRLTRRPGRRGQHHAPTGDVLGCLDQEFPQRDIDVDIVEFVIEGVPHVGRAYEARGRVVLASHPPEFLALGKGHLQPAMTSGNRALDRDFSGHFPNITTTEQGEGSDRRAEWSASSTNARKVVRLSHMIAGPAAEAQAGPSGGHGWKQPC